MKMTLTALLCLVLLWAGGCARQENAVVSTPFAPSPAATTLATRSPQSSAAPAAMPSIVPATDYARLGFDLMLAEALGDVRLDMPQSRLIATLGHGQQSPAVVWGADGLEHALWVYESQGLSLDMARDPDSEQPFSVYSITAVAPCALTTLRGIGIGSSRQAVLTAYAAEIDPLADATSDTIVAGSAAGGLTYTFADDAVISIFIGSAVA
ncbi:MAG: hypothetical protein PHO66_02190 [Eubacteriales bacterium]|nr:hypothetical protein [Eubacteriales bacterium]